MINEHMKILGMKIKDRVTGAKGIATSISFDLYGCIQVVMVAEADKDGKTEGGTWYDIQRLQVIGKKAVMPAPDFMRGAIAEGKKGPAEKPSRSSLPTQ